MHVMRDSAVLLVALGAVGAALLAGHRAAPRAITAAQVSELLSAHNAWRRLVGAASLHWDAELANRAQARAVHLAAHGCLIVHGTLPPDIGENLFFSSAIRYGGTRPDDVAPVTARAVVDTWGAESRDYSAVLGTCAANRPCGHYTQIVWPTTTAVGCGRAVCPSLGQIWVCNYRPPGNISLQTTRRR